MYTQLHHHKYIITIDYYGSCKKKEYVAATDETLEDFAQPVLT
jgi:hypothetical protein